MVNFFKINNIFRLYFLLLQARFLLQMVSGSFVQKNFLRSPPIPLSLRVKCICKFIMIQVFFFSAFYFYMWVCEVYQCGIYLCPLYQLSVYRYYYNDVMLLQGVPLFAESLYRTVLNYVQENFILALTRKYTVKIPFYNKNFRVFIL